MAPRGSRSDHYRAIAGFYGTRLIEDICNPNVPEFVILQEARRAAHYASTALGLEARPRRRKPSDDPISSDAPWLGSPEAGVTSGSIPA